MEGEERKLVAPQRGTDAVSLVRVNLSNYISVYRSGASCYRHAETICGTGQHVIVVIDLKEARGNIINRADFSCSLRIFMHY